MADNEIKSTSYDIQEKWLSEVAPKYFDVNDMNMLRVGLFGYTNEIQANSLEDNVNLMNLISNEVYPNKAVLPNSIYAYAALGDFNSFMAVGSTVNFTLALKKEDLIKYSDQKTNFKQYFISRYSTLDVDGINFMIDYDIIIKLKFNTDNTDYVISAQYDLNYKNPSSSIVNPYIPSKILNIENEEFVFLNLTARQLTRSEVPFKVYSNDIIENLKYDIEYEGNLSYFNVFYKAPSSNELIQVTPYYVDSLKPKDKYFCFYQYTGTNSLSIVFSAHPDYFKPEFNSKLIIEIYTTEGSKGNFVYEGNDVEFAFYTDPENPTFEGNKRLIHYAYIIGRASGGTDAMDIDEIKYNTIKAFSIRKNIISDNDLDYYFSNITGNSKTLFIKKRDDMIKRIYSAYLLLRNKNDIIVPTNTLNLVLYEYQFDNYDTHFGTDNYMLKPGKIYHDYIEIEKHDKDGVVIDVDNYYLLDEDDDIASVIEKEDVSNYFYTCPFLIRVNTNPYFISFFLNSVSDRYGLTYSWINEDNINEFIINNIALERNALLSDTYKIKFKLSTSLNKDLIIEKNENNIYIRDLGNLVGRIYFKKEEVYLGYAKCNIVDVDSMFIYFECEITTNDFITSDDEMILTNCIYRPDTNMEVIREEYAMPSDNIYMEIALFYNGYNNYNKGSLENLTPDNLNRYCLTNLFTTDEPINFFKDINNIEYSTLTLDTKDNYTLFKMKSIPLLKYSYAYNDDNMEEVITLLDYFREELQKSLTVIENNFDIDMKFYNTYGPSKFFTIGRDQELLDTTSIKIYLNIKLSRELSEIIKNDIENFIIKFIEDVNNSESSNYLYASNLIKALENNFDYIRYIEFGHFNDRDTTYQIIENTFTSIDKLTKKQVIKYVPEYLNVSRVTYFDDNGDLAYRPEIYIKYL